MGSIRFGFLVACDVLQTTLCGPGAVPVRGNRTTVRASWWQLSRGLAVSQIGVSRSVQRITRYKSLVGDAMPGGNVVEAKHKIAHNMQL